MSHIFRVGIYPAWCYDILFSFHESLQLSERIAFGDVQTLSALTIKLAGKRALFTLNR